MATCLARSWNECWHNHPIQYFHQFWLLLNVRDFLRLWLSEVQHRLFSRQAGWAKQVPWTLNLHWHIDRHLERELSVAVIWHTCISPITDWLNTFSLFLYVAYRLNNFVIGLTNDDPAITAPVFKTSYSVCAQYSGSVAVRDNATVISSLSYEKFRFVIVHSSLSYDALCLEEVYVYARST